MQFCISDTSTKTKETTPTMTKNVIEHKICLSKIYSF